MLRPVIAMMEGEVVLKSKYSFSDKQPLVVEAAFLRNQPFELARDESVSICNSFADFFIMLPF